MTPVAEYYYRMENNLLFRRAATLVLALGSVFAVWLAMKYALPVALPIIVAWGFGSLVLPLSERLSKRAKVPASVCSILLILLFTTLFALIIIFSASRLLTEVLRLVESLGSVASDGGLSSLTDYLTDLTAHLPIIRDLRGGGELEEFCQGIDAAATDAIFGQLKAMLSEVGNVLLKLLSSLPTTILTLTVTLIASYYFSKRQSREELASLLPSGAVKGFNAVRERAAPVLRGWARAYLLIMALTFAELFVAFSLMGVSYAFLTAAAVALVDLLPILGVGTVLLPWSAISFLMGDPRLGIGLLLTYAVVSLVRQFVEPRLIGKELGIPPLLSIITMYVGFRLFGFIGLISAPAVAMLVANRESIKQ